MEQKRIAFYGKGGIGKTTLAANVAAEFGRRGLKVLFIGCDPKSDSCMNLIGKRIPSVLEQSEALGTSLEEDDIVYKGCFGVSCIEAGGPEAGLGCAGMGFNIMMTELERLEILEQSWDVIIYDVLGDVVCSGFSVPMRNKYADRIFVVSTSAYMSLYAANNIIRSAVRLSPENHSIVGGLILNRFSSVKDMDIADLYCKDTGLECLSVISEDEHWGLSECACKPLNEMFPESKASKELSSLADSILRCGDKDFPKPMSVDDMDEFRNIIWKLYEQH